MITVVRYSKLAATSVKVRILAGYHSTVEALF